MANIKVDELHLRGYDFFQDSESFLNEMTHQTTEMIAGAYSGYSGFFGFGSYNSYSTSSSNSFSGSYSGGYGYGYGYGHRSYH
jgi:hypothetical protein